MSWVFRRLRRKRTVWCYCVLFVCSRGYHFESAYTQLKKRWVILTKTSQTPLVWQLIPRRRTWSQHLIASRFRQIIIKDSQRVPNLVKTLFFDKFFFANIIFHRLSMTKTNSFADFCIFCRSNHDFLQVHFLVLQECM